MIDANEVLKEMCKKYQAAVSANDSVAYRKLFATDAIRIPPGSEPEHGSDEISKNEQKDYDADVESQGVNLSLESTEIPI